MKIALGRALRRASMRENEDIVLLASSSLKSSAFKGKNASQNIAQTKYEYTLYLSEE